MIEKMTQGISSSLDKKGVLELVCWLDLETCEIVAASVTCLSIKFDISLLWGITSSNSGELGQPFLSGSQAK